jgi:hypothetical protein
MKKNQKIAVVEFLQANNISEITEDKYYYALEVVPPKHIENKQDVFICFANGEVYDYENGIGIYNCYMCVNGKYFTILSSIQQAKKVFKELRTLLNIQ